MNDQLVFDEQVAAQLEVFYRSRDVRRRRALVLDALDPQPGDAVLDVGCGPGFYLADVLERGAAVTGVDPAAAMLAIARGRVGDRATVLEGAATALPVPDDSADRALSVQVFEYLPDVDAALVELRRVLRPGGRLVLWDTDWSTVSWHSSDPDRMARVLALWDRHLADPVLPRTLVGALRRAGFEAVERELHPFASTTMDPELFGGAMPLQIRQYLSMLDDVDAAEADAWLADLRALDARGEYAFASLQCCFTATAPG